MSELKVGTRELKSRLSEYLRRVKEGQIITVTEHGKSIGYIIPIYKTVEERIQMMISAGQVVWSGQKPKAYFPVALNSGDRQLSDLVVEDRE